MLQEECVKQAEERTACQPTSPSLSEMEKSGGGNANAITDGVNSIFKDPSPYALSDGQYKKKLVQYF